MGIKSNYGQTLYAEVCDICVEFGEVMLAWYKDWSDLNRNILLSDKAVFLIGGSVNRHNYHYWAGEDLHITLEKMQHRPKVMVWCGMTSDRIVGLFILLDIVNTERYLTMLRGNLAC